MARKRRIQRRRIFVGAEGSSEESFARWLERLCDREGLHVHLDVKVCGGGDTLAVAKYALDQFQRRSDLHGKFDAGLVLLDQDRLEQDRAAGRDPMVAVRDKPLSLIWQKPNLEGVLFRLHPNQERQNVSAQDAVRRLLGEWPKYSRPEPARVLDDRFTLQDLQRAALHDGNLRKLMSILGLPSG